MSTIHVTVTLFATFRDKYQTRQLSVQCDGSITDLVNQLGILLGDEFRDDIYDYEHRKIKDELIFSINGRNIKDIPQEPVLLNDDAISIFPPVAGC